MHSMYGRKAGMKQLRDWRPGFSMFSEMFMLTRGTAGGWSMCSDYLLMNVMHRVSTAIGHTKVTTRHQVRKCLTSDQRNSNIIILLVLLFIIIVLVNYAATQKFHAVIPKGKQVSTILLSKPLSRDCLEGNHSGLHFHTVHPVTVYWLPLSSTPPPPFPALFPPSRVKYTVGSPHNSDHRLACYYISIRKGGPPLHRSQLPTLLCMKPPSGVVNSFRYSCFPFHILHLQDILITT